MQRTSPMNSDRFPCGFSEMPYERLLEEAQQVSRRAMEELHRLQEQYPKDFSNKNLEQKD